MSGNDADYTFYRGSRFGGGRSNKGQPGGGQQKGTGSNISSPTGFTPMGGMSGYGNMGSNNSSSDHLAPEPPKFFFQEKYAKLGVIGNFMPLAAQPKHVDLGDWLAHQGNSSFNQ